MRFDLEPAPADAILGLTAAFKKDERPGKINLAVGVYKDAQGKTPPLRAVVAAEQALLDHHPGHGYLPIDGLPELGSLVRGLLFGQDSELVDGRRAVTAQCPGGTGALRAAGELLRVVSPKAKVWVSTPTWPNHNGIFQAAGFEIASYPWLDEASGTLAFDALMAALDGVAEGDLVLLHGCCHNPTGVDPTPAQWGQIAAKVAERGGLPLMDFAYQGFAVGVEEDAGGLRQVAAACPEVLVASSFSKNLGLYGERAGALTVVASTPEQAQSALSHLKVGIRRMYSNPPAHAGRVVAAVLGDDALRAQWLEELAAMRGRIQGVRSELRAALDTRGVQLKAEGNGFIEAQNGMFTMSGLTKAHVDTLREQHAIYIVGSGRINVAGITPDNLNTLADAIAAVTGEQ